MTRQLLKPFLAFAFVLTFTAGALAQGILLPATGPVNRAMGGATAGAAIESIGSMAFNPATISGLDNEVGFSFEALYSIYEIDSTFPMAGSGSTSSETGANPVPAIAFVYQTQNPNVKLGMGLFAVAGYSSNFPVDMTNPILTPPPAQGGVGLGRIQGEAVFFQMPLALSVQLTETLSVAVGPTMTMAKLPLDENPFVPPNANGVYPRGNGTRYHFGGGGQLGFFYTPNCCWSFGLNLKTPSWIEPLRYLSEDATGAPRTDEVNINLPAVATLGAAYRANENVLITADVRYTDYNNAQGFGEPAAFQPNFAVDGLGWRSIFSAHLGARLRLTDRLYGMVGYMYSDDVIDDPSAFFNLGTDLGYQHEVSIGTSYLLDDRVTFSMAYSYAFEWGSTGPFQHPVFGAIPGSSVTNRAEAHSATFGFNVNF